MVILRQDRSALTGSLRLAQLLLSPAHHLSMLAPILPKSLPLLAIALWVWLAEALAVAALAYPLPPTHLTTGQAGHSQTPPPTDSPAHSCRCSGSPHAQMALP